MSDPQCPGFAGAGMPRSDPFLTLPHAGDEISSAGSAGADSVDGAAAANDTEAANDPEFALPEAPGPCCMLVACRDFLTRLRCVSPSESGTMPLHVESNYGSSHMMAAAGSRESQQPSCRWLRQRLSSCRRDC